MDFKSSTLTPKSPVQSSHGSKANLVMKSDSDLYILSEAPDGDHLEGTQTELYNDRQTMLRYLFLASASFLLVATQMINANTVYAQNYRARITNRPPIVYIYHLSFAICFLSLIGLAACMHFERLLFKNGISLAQHQQPFPIHEGERRRVLSRLTNVVSTMVMISGLLLIVGVLDGCLG